MRRLLIFFTLCLTAGVASALEHEGLRGGMSIDEAAQALSSGGYQVSRTPAAAGMEPMLSFYRKERPWASGTITFCNGSLASYAPIANVSEPPATNDFFDRLDKLTSQYGPASYKTTRGPGPDKRPYMLTFMWRTDAEIVILQYVTMGPRTEGNVGFAYIEPKSCLDPNRR